AADWCEEKVFSWLVDLLYFGRVLQAPLAILARRHDIPVHELIEAVAADREDAPVTAALMARMRAHAAQMQAGGPEWVASERDGGLFWPMNQAVLIDLVRDGELDAFYTEAEGALLRCLEERGLAEESALVALEAVDLARALLVRPGEHA